MTDRELRKLSRRDLLELLVSQGRERDALQAELEKTKIELQDRQLHIEQAGSIAEAALQLNGVFDAAQAAAGQYLENIRQRSEQIEEICSKREEECRRTIESRLLEAEKAAKESEEETRKKCLEMEREAKEKAQSYWTEISARIEKICKDHEELRGILDFGGDS